MQPADVKEGALFAGKSRSLKQPFKDEMFL
jgi:hypothetical protein